MVISSAPSSDAAAQAAAQAFDLPRQNQSSGSATQGGSAATPDELGLDAFDESGPLDGSQADQLRQSLTQNMFDNAASAVGAHSGLNPQSVFDLLN